MLRDRRKRSKMMPTKKRDVRNNCLVASSETSPTEHSPVYKNTRSKKALIGECTTCGFIPTEEIYAHAIKISHTVFDSSRCIQCAERDMQLHRSFQRNRHLQSLYNRQQQSRRSCITPNETMSINLEVFLNNQLKTYAPLIIRLYARTEWRVNVIDVENDTLTAKEYNDEVCAIKCALWDADDTESPHPNTLQHNDSVDLTVVKLGNHKGKWDFLAISNPPYDQNSMNSLSAHENESILCRVKANRPGPASGFLQFQEESFSHTRVTQKPTSLMLAASPRGSAMGKLYINDNNVVKLCNFGYPKLLMNRLTKEEKLQYSQNNPFYQSILVKEALAYIASVACLVSLGIIKNDKYFPQLNGILKECDDKSIEIALVRWMTSTGEMRNHQQLPCHTDSNKSNKEHPLELYSIHNRVDSQQGHGFLYFPLQNFCLRVASDKNVVVCNLSHSPHTPDKSRNTDTWSRVHGPRP